MKRYRETGPGLFGSLPFGDTIQAVPPDYGTDYEQDDLPDDPEPADRPDLEGLAQRLAPYLAALPPSPADPLDHHQRFGVTNEERSAALEYVADTNEEFLDVEEWAHDREEAGDTAGAAQAQDICDAILAEYFANPPDDEDAPVPGRCLDCHTELMQDADGVDFCPLCRNETLRKQSCLPFEEWLRERGFPFVAVDEAKKAIFSGAAVASFDFLVYSSEGANLLVLLEKHPSADQLADMAEWEKTFGPDFRAVLVWNDGAHWVGVPLLDWTGNTAQARPLRDMI
jgi:hypothetical protein